MYKKIRKCKTRCLIQVQNSIFWDMEIAWHDECLMFIPNPLFLTFLCFLNHNIYIYAFIIYFWMDRSCCWLVLIQMQLTTMVNLCFTELLPRNIPTVLLSYWKMEAANQWALWTPGIWRKCKFILRFFWIWMVRWEERNETREEHRKKNRDTVTLFTASFVWLTVKEKKEWFFYLIISPK